VDPAIDEVVRPSTKFSTDHPKYDDFINPFMSSFGYSVHEY
jgi:hypothetical protein